MPAVNRSGASVPRQRGGNIIGQFHPRVRGGEHVRRGAQAVQNLAEEPLARIRPAAFGEILRTDFSGEYGDFRRLGHAGVVLPQPRHRGGILGKVFVEREWLAMGIHRQRRAAGRVHAQADHLLRLEGAHFFLRVGECLFDGDFRALDVVRGMLPGKIGIAAQEDALGSVFVIPDRRASLVAIGHIHDEGADRVRPVIQTDGVFGAHG